MSAFVFCGAFITLNSILVAFADVGMEIFGQVTVAAGSFEVETTLTSVREELLYIHTYINIQFCR